MNHLRSCSLRDFLCTFLVVLLAGGCGEDDSATRQDPPVQVGSSRVAAEQGKPGGSGPGGGGNAAANVLRTGPFQKTFDGIGFSIPPGWEEVENPTPEFVDARFQIPTPHGVVKLTFSSNSGGADVNIQRWIGQFQIPSGKQPAVENMNVDGAAAKWVDIRGEFVGGAMAGSPSSSGPVERMLGVAIPLGNRDFYLKLTGTDAAVSEVRESFREFVRGARLSSGGSNGK
jgi:hypothetical protein